MPERPVLSITTDYSGGATFLDEQEYAHIAEAGFGAIHWCQHWTGPPRFYGQGDAEGIRRLLAFNNLQMADLHGYGGYCGDISYTTEMFIAVNLNRIEFLYRLGGRAIVLHLPICPDEPLTRRLDNARRIIDALTPASQDSGVTITGENLGPATGLDFFGPLLEEYPTELFGLCFDAGHANIHGQYDFPEQFGDRVVCMHLHDNDARSDQHRIPVEGTVDWPRVVSALKASGYAGTVNLEVKRPEDMPLPEFLHRCRIAAGEIWQAG